MNELFIKKTIIDALQLKDPEITEIQNTPGGVTNMSYFATVNGEKCVVRIPGNGTDELVNRKEEKDNLLFGTRLGINPSLLYFNITSGVKITKKIEGALPITPTLARKDNTMKQLIHLFQHLHSTKIPMENDFNLFSLMNYYESLIVDRNEIMIGKLAEFKKDILALQTIYESFHIKKVPSHIDAVGANIIKDKHDEMYLIDWEYSGNFDPLWDIAALFITFDLQEDERHFFLTQYLERNPSEEEIQRIFMHTIFQDYLWCLWGLFKEAQGDDIGGDPLMRIERATENIALYKKVYEEDIVV